MRNRSKQLVNGAQSARKITRDIQNHDRVLIRMVPKEVIEISAFQRKKEAVLDRPKRGSTGNAFDDRHLAKEIS